MLSDSTHQNSTQDVKEKINKVLFWTYQLHSHFTYGIPKTKGMAIAGGCLPSVLGLLCVCSGMKESSSFIACKPDSDQLNNNHCN